MINAMHKVSSIIYFSVFKTLNLVLSAFKLGSMTLFIIDFDTADKTPSNDVKFRFMLTPSILSKH